MRLDETSATCIGLINNLKPRNVKVNYIYNYGKDYVYCNEYREDEQFVQPLNSNGKPLCTIAKTNIIAIKEYK